MDVMDMPDTKGKNAFSSMSSLIEQGRAIYFSDGYVGIFQIIGAVVALFVLFYLVSYTFAVLFDRRPMWKRSLDINGMPPMMVVNPLNSAQLTETVHSALDKKYK